MQKNHKLVYINGKTFEVLLTQTHIQARIRELAWQIHQSYPQEQTIYLIGVLNGAFRFVADLLTYFPQDRQLCVDFTKISSYAGTYSTGEIHPIIGLKQGLKNKHVLLVEDIIDTGLTIQYLTKQIQQQQPFSVKIATLLFKPQALRTSLQPDFIGFEIEPLFVIGYGLDYNEQGRNLNDIYVLKD
ncbi:MAG: hypoxanthine phosphoribosyltransferase [Microscillaceae bacterium]|nr:hypoxanthine phosphoribosyltransferase [Microscillaceae bacterium]MDW8461293.1 hypoxanthine phosphoribosyltransferase [Cytophagales bacterium]